ncbi:alpha/beta fold hydrolase [Paraglaciecola psychrophila]|jgi:pimeloyl-ACP methyl ester carboxylesterase|uniref:Alpha/beta hydrolase n=1 Tax=Paraglaciecola psychrophila 170 TaxID=1129794 RepID=K6YXA9_9ALTE|nr:alpha/beta hydrolase [Paraglaciecola psychrophila]AGH43939.1 alpha/beta hydrolase [Paraglaciecola psychrophila 170]GAC37339.1 alpha/beta hydrolase fold [Paraglaciecola psychrophila 170]
MKHHTIDIENVNVHYVEAGEDNVSQSPRQTIIFLHGFPEFWGTWHAQLDYFANNYRVIAPDLPGYNLSGKPQENTFFEVPNLIQFIAKFIQCVAPQQKIILVAHDWGGVIAWPLTAFFPQLIDRLVILNAAHPSTFTREMIHNAEQRQKSEYIHDLIAPNGVEKVSNNNYKYLKDKILIGMREGTLSNTQRKVYEKVWAQPGAVNGMLQYYRAMPQLAPSEKEMGAGNGPVVAATQMKIPNIRITCPTLILWGEQDQAFVKETVDGVEEYVPDVRIKRFPDASHWLQHELPNEVNAEIDNFLKST